MKRTLLLAMVFCFCQLSYAESAIIDYIVYDLNLDDLTATVLNFQTNTEFPCDVKIPRYVWYKNDTYKVTRIKCNYYSKYDYEYGYNYEEARANIEHLELPNTLEEIEKGAFAGMRRLKSLIIPASVKTFTYVAIWDLLGGGSFDTYPRLETIIIQGTPTCKYYIGGTEREISVGSQIETEDFDYIKTMAYIVARVDSLTNKSKLCPNLKLFSMPNAKEAIEAAKKNKSWCSFYNARLEELCAEYNEKLKEHIFYDGTILTYESVKLSDDREIMKHSYNLRKENLFNDYKALVGKKMEMNLRKNDKEKFIECYKIAHPEKKVFIDSILLEYSCHEYPGIYKLNDVIIDAIDGKNINFTSCREEYYEKYGYLFNNRGEFNEQYNLAKSNADFEDEIRDRKNAKAKLARLESDLKLNPTVKLQGMRSSKDNAVCKFKGQLAYFKEEYYYAEAVALVLSLNEKAKKEYEKNGQYFTNQKDFFEAYISSKYKTILKDKKRVK